VPFFLCGTAGTSAFGRVDDLEGLHKIA